MIDRPTDRLHGRSGRGDGGGWLITTPPITTPPITTPPSPSSHPVERADGRMLRTRCPAPAAPTVAGPRTGERSGTPARTRLGGPRRDRAAGRHLVAGGSGGAVGAARAQRLGQDHAVAGGRVALWPTSGVGGDPGGSASAGWTCASCAGASPWSARRSTRTLRPGAGRRRRGPDRTARRPRDLVARVHRRRPAPKPGLCWPVPGSAATGSPSGPSGCCPRANVNRSCWPGR